MNRIVGKVLRNVEIRRVIDVLGRADNEFVIPLELTEQYAPAVRIEPVHVFVVPDLLSSEGRSTPLLEDDLMDAVTREKVALALPPLDRHGREIEIDDHLLQTRTRLEVNLQHFGLTVRIDRHIEDFTLRIAFGDVVLLVARDTLDGAALHQDRAVLAVAVEDVVDRPLVVALEHPDIIDILVEKGFVAYLRNHIAAVFGEHDHVVDIRTVAHELGILHRLADSEEALHTIDVQFGIGDSHLRRFDRVELAQLGTPLAALAVFVADTLVISNRIIGQMRQMVLRLGDILLDLPDLVVGLVAVVTRNTDELQLRQTLDVLGRDRTAQHLGKRFQPLADGCVSLLAGFAALDELIQFINDENPLQRSRMPCFVEFVQADFKLHFQQLAGMLR